MPSQTDMMPILVAFVISYVIRYFYTAHPWMTVLKIWLWGWLICGVGNLLWTLFSHLFSKSTGDKSADSLKIPLKIEMVWALVQSMLMLYWPSFIYGRLEEWWEDFAIRRGWKEKPAESVLIRKKNVKAVRDTKNTWQLEGESDLSAITIPDPPTAKVPTTIRLTHDNSYGPFDDVNFYVRVGDPEKPTDEFDLNGAKDWVKASLVEELVIVDNQEMFRSEIEELPKDETPWEGAFEAELAFPSGRRSVEIKIVRKHAKLLASRVLADWKIDVA